jgi:hypothetical protein
MGGRASQVDVVCPPSRDAEPRSHSGLLPEFELVRRRGRDATPGHGPIAPAFSVSAGGAWTDLPVLGGLRDVRGGVAMVVLELRHTFKTTGRVSFDYLAGIVPVELQTGIVMDDSPGVRETGLGRTTVYGAGLDPVGISLRVGGGEWRPFTTLRGGVRFFQHRLPDPLGSRFNFVADLGLGVQRHVGPHTEARRGRR